uniref:uromodulin-like isoform X2 n=1 Tax=Ciona intestinalis TaxID=7719 RepID=UPI000EF52526|nr:uromodulin-like isoform X2 [Ciona intestinalis]|eukprot:XP_026695929.1 uromodulin-like isoform X2 [Ciona intestinalis]
MNNKSFKRIIDKNFSKMIYVLVMLTVILGVIESAIIQFPNAQEEGTSITPAFKLYKDKTFTQELKSLPKFTSDENLFIEISVKANVKLVLHQCWGSPSKSSTDPTRFTFIQSGCAFNHLVSTQILMNGVSSKVQFTHKVFHFNVDQAETYIHCTIEYCATEPCQPVELFFQKKKKLA